MRKTSYQNNQSHKTEIKLSFVNGIDKSEIELIKIRFKPFEA